MKKARPGKSTEPQESGFITADKLCSLTGLTDKEHRKLAADGFFPKPKRDQYELVPTLRGLFRYYRELNAKQEAAPTMARSKAELAQIIGCSRWLVVKASQMEGWPRALPGGQWRVKECRAFIAEHSDALDDATPSGDLTRLRAEVEMERKRKLKLENDETEGRLIDIDALSRESGPALLAITNLTYHKLENEVPIALAGVDVPQGRIIGRRFAEELIGKWKEVFRKWNT